MVNQCYNKIMSETAPSKDFVDVVVGGNLLVGGEISVASGVTFVTCKFLV